MGTETKFSLPNRKVTVKFINRKRGMATGSWVGEDHAISGGMLTTAVKKIYTPLKRTGGIANVLTKEEKDYLEQDDVLGLNLSVYANKDFWEQRYVELRKGDTILDLSDPMEYINYKILLHNKDYICPNLEDVNKKLTYWFVLVDEGEENKLNRKSFNYKKKAFKLYSKIEDDKHILRGIIKFIDRKAISEGTSIDWLQSRIEQIIDKTPEKFVSFLEDSNYETKILLSNAEDAGIVVQQNKRYMTSDGIELCYEGELASYDNAVRYLSDPLNQELVDVIKSKLNKI